MNTPNIKAAKSNVARSNEILNNEALAFVAELEAQFGNTRTQLMTERGMVQDRLTGGERLDFRSDTEGLRKSDWRIREAPADLQDRRVEITGPVDRKMIINALNSDANAFMADFEDSCTPSWENIVAGHVNLADAVRRRLDPTTPETGKSYHLTNDKCVLIVRPRGLHMTEAHVLASGRPVSAAFFDFGTFVISNAKELVARGTGPYLYLPKLECYEEACLWSEVIEFAESYLGLSPGTIRVTVLIETITAAFQMDEILHALRNHIVGLNCGRWDYIFNYIKRHAQRKEFVLPDRDQVNMGQPFLRTYSKLLIQTCHRRGAHAMGGMAAQIPIKNDDQANHAAMERFQQDKTREAKDGHDGTWVAHPGLIANAKKIFDSLMPTANQINTERRETTYSADDLLQVPVGSITEAGLRKNISVALHYISAWLSGFGCVPIRHLMEDAATAEISRTQIWQWRHHSAVLDNGQIVSSELIQELVEAESDKLRQDEDFLGAFKQSLSDSVELLLEMTLSNDIDEFLTTKAYFAPP